MPSAFLIISWLSPTFNPYFYNLAITYGVAFFLSKAKCPSVLWNLTYGENTSLVFNNAYWIYLNGTDYYFYIPNTKITGYILSNGFYGLLFSY